jgi:hypothetical protein
MIPTMTYGIAAGKLRRRGTRRTEPIAFTGGKFSLGLIGAIYSTTKIRLAARCAQIKGI